MVVDGFTLSDEVIEVAQELIDQAREEGKDIDWEAGKLIPKWYEGLNFHQREAYLRQLKWRELKNNQWEGGDRDNRFDYDQE